MSAMVLESNGSGVIEQSIGPVIDHHHAARLLCVLHRVWVGALACVLYSDGHGVRK
jgi:hypothetical protein